MNGNTSNFEFVMASNCPNNISQCVDGNNVLNNQVTVFNTATGGLKFEEDDDGVGICRIANNVTFNIGDGITPLKAIFIRDANTKSVFMYCINITPFNVTNSFIFNKDTILFSIRRGL